MDKTFNDINSVYFHSLNELKTKGRFVNSVTDPTSIGSNFGNKSRDFVELQGFSFQLTNPRNRLIFSEYRKLSMGFNIANFLWFMSGSKDVESISFYNKFGKAFSNNGKYYEAAFGDRIFGTYNLIENAKKLLISDSTSRRVLIPLFFPDDLKTLPNDTPCASSIQLMIRNNKLDFFLHMRSQSVIMVFPYDIFLFTMLHEYLSILLGKELGIFNYYANSFHYYTEEEPILVDILSENYIEPIPMKEMPPTSIDELVTLLEFENKIRNSILKKGKSDFSSLNLFSNYWKELLYLLCAKAEIENDYPSSNFTSDYLTFKNMFL